MPNRICISDDCTRPGLVKLSGRCSRCHYYWQRAECQRFAYVCAMASPAPLGGGRVNGKCRVCDTWFTSEHSDITCSKTCQTMHKREVRRDLEQRRRARKRNAFVANVYRLRVFEADGYRCHICHRKTDATKAVPHPRAPTLDHVIPLAKGGTHEPMNCRTACFQCNATKSDRGGGEQFALAI